jgi:hypothetical protein
MKFEILFRRVEASEGYELEIIVLEEIILGYISLYSYSC